MKRIFLLLTLIPAMAIAQDGSTGTTGRSNNASKYKWEIGLNGGVNITSVTGLDYTGKMENRIGKMYGVTLIYHASRFLSLKTDFDFENKGWVLKGYDVTTASPSGLSTTTQNINQNLDYFDVPLFLHFGFGNKIKLDLNVGTYMAFLVSEKAFYVDADGTQVPVTDALFTGYKSYDLGLTYGGGIDYALSDRLSFGFDLLYEQGLIAIKDGGLKNTSLDFDFGINILLGKKGKK